MSEGSGKLGYSRTFLLALGFPNDCSKDLMNCCKAVPSF